MSHQWTTDGPNSAGRAMRPRRRLLLISGRPRPGLGWITAMVVVSVALLVAACGSGSQHQTSGSGSGSAGNAVGAVNRDATLRFAINASYGTLDPVKSTLAVDPFFQLPVYERLLTVAQGVNGLKVVPQLAKSYTVAPDGRSITLELLSGVTFQDGTPFNAAAVKTNFARAQGPDSLVASKLKAVKSVDVTDPTHVVINLTQPDPAFVWTLATGTATMMVSPAAFNTDLSAKPVGTDRSPS